MLDHVDVVLVRPSEPRNIGASCRAAKSAGITRLIVVTDRPIDWDAARPLAIGAEDMIDSMRVEPDLASTLSGYSLVAGATRRHGQRRKRRVYSPWELATVARSASPRRVAVLFGNERSGLTDDELAFCNAAVDIPTSQACPSLNLSHAVQVICYELFSAAYRGDGAPPLRGGAPPIDQDRLSAGVRSIVDSLHSIGYPTQPGPQGSPVFLSDVLGRAQLSSAEIERLESLFADLSGRWRSEHG